MTDENDDWLPVIQAAPMGSSKNALRRAWREAARQALAEKAVAEAIMPSKAHGSPNGHKVLDNGAAVTALIKVAPEHLKGTLEMDGLTLFDKTQCLDAALRPDWEIDKKGKLTGQRSQKYLARTAHAEH
jgi:hypothetical protein